MNKVVRTLAAANYLPILSHHSHLSPSFFHSTPILERKRRTNWSNRFSSYYKKRGRKVPGKGQSQQNVGDFAEELFMSWKYQDENYRPPYSRTNQWFTREFVSNRNQGGRSRSSGPKPGSRRRFDFSIDDEVEVDEMFRAAFGGNKHFYRFFTDEEPERENTSRYNTRRARNWRRDSDDESDSEEEYNCSTADLISYRQALGLKVTGPLCLEDVKNAYRSCALKWHPDRHQGSSKADAEEKFKICSAAYQSLCDRMVS